MTVTPSGLARKSVGTPSLTALGISASAPMTVLAGSVVATFATTEVGGVPFSFLLLLVPLFLVTVGLVTFSRDISHVATFYAFLARGLGRIAGTAGAAVSLIAYNAIQISLYGLFGGVTSSLYGGLWWVWALAAWAVVGLLGVRRVKLNTRVVGVVAFSQILVIGLFIAAGLSDPAAPGASLAPLSPTELFVPGLGGVLAFSIAAFIGFESIVVYREEAREHNVVRRAAYGTVVFLGLFYAVASWALVAAVGSTSIIQVAQDPAADLPFAILDDSYNSLVSSFGRGVFLLSIIAAMVAFHNVVARYVFGLSREGVLPMSWSVTGGAAGGVPVGGSVAQSATALVTIILFAGAGADPIAVMFTVLSTIAALGVVSLLVGSCAAVIRFYALMTERPSVWQWLVAPAVGGISLGVVLVVTIANTTGFLQWSIPLLIAAVGLGGAIWSAILRSRRPSVYNAIGRGQPRPLAVLDRSLSHLEL